MADGVDFTCPNCEKLHFITFVQIKKNQKSGLPLVFEGGCSLSPDQVLDQMALELKAIFRKKYPKLGE
jgi:hypothetical protein